MGTGRGGGAVWSRLVVLGGRAGLPEGRGGLALPIQLQLARHRGDARAGHDQPAAAARPGGGGRQPGGGRRVPRTALAVCVIPHCGRRGGGQRGRPHCGAAAERAGGAGSGQRAAVRPHPAQLDLAVGIPQRRKQQRLRLHHALRPVCGPADPCAAHVGSSGSGFFVLLGSV